MNNSNSYNVCTRCGTPNSLSAKYCYQCGGQLKVPEQPVVCEKCNTVNTGMANFCRNCGSTLKIGTVTKNCPRCGKPVAQEMSQCSCGYSFAVNKPVRAKDKASDPVDIRTGKKLDMVDVSTKGKSKASGRVFSIISLLFVLVVAALYALPTAYRPEFLSALFVLGGSSNLCLFEIAVSAINGGLAGLALGQYITYGVLALFAVCVVIHLLVAIIGIFSGCRFKHANWQYFVFAIISIVALALVWCAENNTVVSVLSFVSIFALPSGVSFGYLLYGVPVYYLVVFFASFATKRKKAQTV